MDSEYLKKHVGDALIFGLSEVCQKKPSDPIDYLSKWLLKYVENVHHKAELARNELQLAKEREIAAEEKRRVHAMEEEQDEIASEVFRHEKDALVEGQVDGDSANIGESKENMSSSVDEDSNNNGNISAPTTGLLSEQTIEEEQESDEGEKLMDSLEAK